MTTDLVMLKHEAHLVYLLGFCPLFQPAHDLLSVSFLVVLMSWQVFASEIVKFYLHPIYSVLCLALVHSYHSLIYNHWPTNAVFLKVTVKNIHQLRDLDFTSE